VPISRPELPPSDPATIEVRGLHKRFEQTHAVDDLELCIPRGCFYGLLGPNGAGKSTTIALLTGLLRPDAGTIQLFGRDFDGEDPAIKRRMGVASDEPPLYGRLRGGEQLRFAAEMYGLAPSEARARADELLQLLGLDHAERTLVVDYSRGMRKKLGIACALIHAPDLLFFDEPFEGVDALSAETIRRLLHGLAAGGVTVLLTTHILEVAEKLCERVGIIHRGALRAEHAVAELRAEGTSLAEHFARVVGLPNEELALPSWLAVKR
jgi:ABC-2 type transport system ATP-binding protein